jgi:DNA-binding transcriptional MerR regulator
MKTYTITEVARILKVPESTARYQRNKFSEYLPYTGEGRTRRYFQESIEALKLIGDMLKENNTIEEIESTLGARFGVNLESQRQPVATQQQYDIAPLLAFLEKQEREIAELRQDIAERDRKIVGMFEEIRERQEEIRERQKKPIWKRLFWFGTTQ